MISLKTDCRHFRSDRPCAPHKASGVVCESCVEFHDPVEHRVLVVKLAAIGDVLRTTSFLPAIHRRWSHAHVTWVTSPAAAPLLRGNPLVDRVLTFSGHLPVELTSERFDVIINPDAAEDTCAVAHAARGLSRVGFDLDERNGHATPLSAGAEHWFELGLRDDLKRANRRTYQELVADVIGLDYRREPPQFELDADGRRRSEDMRDRYAPANGALVGINTGAGGRWRYKRWTDAGTRGLIDRLAAAGHRVLLLGGPEERERNQRLAGASGGVAIDTGCDNSLPQFAGIVDACDAVLTGDTLAMHVAIARRVPVVVLFGPTSLHEIDIFDRGERLAADLPCLCCYLSNCEVHPTCMDRLSVDAVQAAVTRVLALPRVERGVAGGARAP